MAIKPIDMQIMMPRVNEMSRVQNNEQQRTQASHQNAVQTTEKQSESNTRQVNSREETHNTAIREKQQNEKGNRSSRIKRINLTKKENCSSAKIIKKRQQVQQLIYEYEYNDTEDEL